MADLGDLLEVLDGKGEAAEVDDESDDEAEVAEVLVALAGGGDGEDDGLMGTCLPLRLTRWLLGSEVGAVPNEHERSGEVVAAEVVVSSTAIDDDDEEGAVVVAVAAVVLVFDSELSERSSGSSSPLCRLRERGFLGGALVTMAEPADESVPSAPCVAGVDALDAEGGAAALASIGVRCSGRRPRFICGASTHSDSQCLRMHCEHGRCESQAIFARLQGLHATATRFEAGGSPAAAAISACDGGMYLAGSPFKESTIIEDGIVGEVDAVAVPDGDMAAAESDAAPATPGDEGDGDKADAEAGIESGGKSSDPVVR